MGKRKINEAFTTQTEVLGTLTLSQTINYRLLLIGEGDIVLAVFLSGIHPWISMFSIMSRYAISINISLDQSKVNITRQGPLVLNSLFSAGDFISAK